MTTLEGIKQICRNINSYSFYFDDRQLMNVNADEAPFPLIFFEEYREGSYQTKHFFEKSTRVELYFCKLCQMHNDGEERERLREEIEAEAVRPFIKLFNAHPEIFTPVTEWRFYTPPPRFDANEVSIMLQFNATLTQC